MALFPASSSLVNIMERIFYLSSLFQVISPINTYYTAASSLSKVCIILSPSCLEKNYLLIITWRIMSGIFKMICNCWGFLNSGASGWNLKLPPLRRGQRETKERGRPLPIVGGGVNKQGNLCTRFVSGAPTCQKLKSLDRSIYGVQSWTLSQHILLTGVSLRITGRGNGGQNMHSKDQGGCEEPLIAWVQCSVQLLCPLWPPPAARCDCTAFSTDQTALSRKQEEAITLLDSTSKTSAHTVLLPTVFTRTMWPENSFLSWNIPFKYCFLFETILIPSHRASFVLCTNTHLLCDVLVTMSMKSVLK